MSEFIPQPYKAENISIYIKKDKLALVDKLANEFKVNRSAFINQCIDYAIEHMPTDRKEDGQ